MLLDRESPMGLKKLSAKVADYFERLEQGYAARVKPSHVRKVLDKLHKKEASLAAEIAATGDETKAERLKRKLEIVREHIERAKYLLEQLS